MARLGKGVRERKDGLLEKRFSVNGERFSVFGHTQKEITEKEIELREKIRNGFYKNNKNITLNDYFTEWIKRREKINKANTIRLYKTIYYTHIEKEIGAYKVCDIEKRQIIALQEKVAENNRIETANYILTLLNIVFNECIAEDIIIKNPCFKIRRVKSDKEKATDTIHRALTIDEQRAFMQEMKENYYYELFAFMLVTGMRVGEVGALTWQDIDIKNNVKLTQKPKAL